MRGPVMALTLASLVAPSARGVWEPLYTVGGGRFALGSPSGAPTHMTLDANGTRLVAAQRDGRVVVRGLADASRDTEWYAVDTELTGLAAAAGVTAWSSARAVAWRGPTGGDQRVALPAPNGLALSPDGARLAVGSGADVVVFDTATGRQSRLRAPQGLSGLGFAGDVLLAASPAGLAALGDDAPQPLPVTVPGRGPLRLVTGGATWIVWREGHGVVGRLGRSERRAVRCVGAALSSSGRTALLRYPERLDVVTTLRPDAVVQRLAAEDVLAFAVSPDGALAVTVRDDGVALLRDSRTGRDRSPGGPPLHATAMAWAGDRLWLGDRSGQLAAFEGAREVQRATGVHRDSITFLAPVAGGEEARLLTAGLDREVSEHRVSALTGQLHRPEVLAARFAGPRAGGRSVYSGAVSPDGHLAALALGGGVVEVRALGGDGEARPLTLPRAPLSVAVDDGGQLAIAGDGGGRYGPTANGYALRGPLPTEGARAVAWMNGGLAVGTATGQVLVTDPEGQSAQRVALERPVGALCATAAGLAVGLDDGTVLLLDRALNVVRRSAKAPGGAVLALSAQASGGLLAARGSDGRVTVFDLGSALPASP